MKPIAEKGLLRIVTLPHGFELGTPKPRIRRVPTLMLPKMDCMSSDMHPKRKITSKSNLRRRWILAKLFGGKLTGVVSEDAEKSCVALASCEAARYIYRAIGDRTRFAGIPIRQRG